ncbi:MAG TPA: OmpH family outer membrane protein [Bacteroidia bacterium]|nr:OmpH family outer membrane protein [Bacteroidia bacterium]
MNKILIGVNAILVAAVAFLFFKVNSLTSSDTKTTEDVSEKTATAPQPAVKLVVPVGNVPTGQIAYINIDELNEKSLEINDLITEAKKRRNNIEASLESLNLQYQKKMEEYQTSAKAGIAPASEMQMKEKEIMSIEKEAQNKQLQMESLSVDINEKNGAFQKNVKNFLIKWNKGRYDFILSYSDAVPSMLLGNTTLEITSEIIEELNAEYKQSKTKK